MSQIIYQQKYLENHVAKREIYWSKNESKNEALKAYLHSCHHLFQLGHHIYHCLQQSVVSQQILSQDQQRELCFSTL